MPQRPNNISLATRSGRVEISWTARDALLDEFRNIVREFQAVGAARPVNLDRHGKRLVVEAIQAMADRTEPGVDGIDPHLLQLRRRLVDELNPSTS